MDPIDTDSDNWGLEQLRERNFYKYRQGSNNSNGTVEYVCDKLRNCDDETCVEDNVPDIPSNNIKSLIKKASVSKSISAKDCADDSEEEWMQQRQVNEEDEFEEDGSDWEDEY